MAIRHGTRSAKATYRSANANSRQKRMIVQKSPSSTLFSRGARGSPCLEAVVRAEPGHEIATAPAFIERLRSILGAWAKNRETVGEMAQRIQQLQSDKQALEAQLAALTLKEAASSHDSSHDALTGLPNRTLIKDRFQQAKALADRRGVQLVVLFLDIDRFKQVNDRFGHVVGDRVLQMAAARLQAIVRATDTACRFGGDEFVILLTNVDDGARASYVAQEIHRRLANPYNVGARSIVLQASIGAAVYPQDGITWETLVAHADKAMYRAKASARSP